MKLVYQKENKQHFVQIVLVNNNSNRIYDVYTDSLDYAKSVLPTMVMKFTKDNINITSKKLDL